MHSPIIQMSARFTIFSVFSHTIPAKEKMPLRRECEQRGRKTFKALLNKDHGTALEHLILFLSLFQHTSCCGSVLWAVPLCPPCWGEGSIQKGLHLSDTTSSPTDWRVPAQPCSHRPESQLILSNASWPTQTTGTAELSQVAQCPWVLQVTVLCSAQPPFLHLQGWSGLSGFCLEAGCDT